ncbi:N-acetylmuramoyl-L-alanine amidase [Photobacterium sp. GB-27]|nr:N-acetylmuramoyl-L-alanine amidase [Photobacterium sp. GB-56]PSV29932.1 N-acetylmuramoyl-L-alanine amidase [Photobacterium sp. GB-72]PSV35120.1 N-acetylmuramoyl-L-alanine amidase [Photobacterium sp. GB-210]PSV36140.1 N-acetylmuramoyl-L-alanine amidase [Photobacterium sp. GB-27]PSV41234.1 N-acetylmuramoyl-L-alanine amidase [Photobacterium sp. GB-36]PSV51106.1 N-acetylmuramoyl-L-alanine amidase [Photobacterium sp. GB-1]PSV52390.1 N-acetylmuramoyl-L-alanine amidase [Photobacterium sp. GB-3]P
MSSAASWANELKGVRIWPAPDETRVVLDLQSKADYSHFSLAGPSRLVVDLKDTKIKTKLPIAVQKSDILTKVRTSTAPAKGTTRLVFEVKRGVTPTIFSLSPTGSYGYRLVLDLPNGTSKTVGAKEEQAEEKATANNLAKMPSGTADIVVAVDAGHGGDDPGSIGPTRKYEKNVTLAVAKKLAAKINATTGMRAVLTRRGDYFVPLGKRSEIARKNKALLLVSIHADGFTKPQPRGASVWVLNTRRANTEIGRWLEQSEKQSELLGGGDVLSSNTNDKYLGRAVLDLQFSYSQKEGYDVATRVLHELRKVARLHKTVPQYASLAVLKSPDIPSLLVETGFITNPTEEKLLNTTSHQNQLANAVYKGVLEYFEANPPEGTLFASRLKGRGSKHKVTSGQSLSGIAQKYGVSMASIKASNNLKSTSVNIGQVLIIPGNIKTASVSTPTKTVSTTSSSATVKPVASTKVIVHKVVRGEYLGKIAAKYGVTMSSIRQLNHLKSDNVMLGQKLKIAVPAPKYVQHKVKRGEFLSKIADKYGVSVASIRATNKLRSDKLAVGQTLIIPRS